MRKKLILLALVLLLTGCSAFGFLFERLPWLVNWQLDRMLDLNEAQEQIVEKGAESMQEWFISEGFPLLIVHLETTQQRWRTGRLDRAVTYLESALADWIAEFLRAVEPHLMPLLLSIDEQNAEQFRQYNADKAQEWFEYAESEAKKRAQRKEKLEDWFGPLTQQQHTLVDQNITLFDAELKTRRDNNQHWKEMLLQSALDRDTQDLKRWINDPSVWWTEDYTSLRTANRQQWRITVKSLLPTLSAEQRQHADQRVQDWIENLYSVL